MTESLVERMLKDLGANLSRVNLLLVGLAEKEIEVRLSIVHHSISMSKPDLLRIKVESVMQKLKY